MKDANDLINNMINKFDQKSNKRNSEVSWRKEMEEAQKSDANYYHKKYGNKAVITTVPSYQCKYKKCDGTGWITTVYPPYGYREDYQYSCEVVSKCICNGGKDASEFRRIHSMIPSEYLDKRGKDFKWDLYQEDINRQKSIINSFITKFSEFDNHGKGLYIYSTTRGSGKTFLSCCIANELSEKGIKVKFINVLDLIDLCKKNFDKDAYRDEIDALFNAHVLIIDDLGCEKGSEWFDNLFLRLVNTRHGKKKIMIYTSNICPERLKFDDRISSRIQEASINIKLPDENIRSILAKEKTNEFLKNIMT